jgi:hypothetical protein
MNRRVVSIAVAVALGVLLGTLWMRVGAERKSPAPKNAVPVIVEEGSLTPDLGSATLPIADAAAYAELHASTLTARDDVRIVAGLVQNYQQAVKTGVAAPPLGFNEEITRALTGRNPLEVAFLPATHPAINARGLLCDRWGTPYHFHPVAQDRIDVRSAGPDKKLFTTDDSVNADAPPAANAVAASAASAE